MVGGSGSSGSSNQQSTQQLDPVVKQEWLNNLNNARGVASNLGVQQFAPRTGDYNTGEALIRGLPTGPGVSAMQAGINGIAQNGATYAPSVVGGYLNPYTDYVAGNTVNNLARANQIALNGVAGDATSKGAFGGSRSGVAQAETNRNFFNTLGTTLGNIYDTAYTGAIGQAQNDLSRSLTAQNNLVSAGSALNTTDQSNAQGLTNLGLADQAYAQQQLDAERNLPLEQQSITNTALGLNPAGGSGMQSQSSGSGSNSSFGFSLFNSDERLKDNVHEMPDALKTLKGITGHTYTYKEDPATPTGGVMAQDVEKVMPGAVVTKPDGMKAVDYTQVTGLLVNAVKDLDKKISKKKGA